MSEKKDQKAQRESTTSVTSPAGNFNDIAARHSTETARSRESKTIISGSIAVAGAETKSSKLPVNDISDEAPVTFRDAQITTFVAWLEGPAATSDGSVYFSDVKGNRIYRLNSQGDLSVY